MFLIIAWRNIWRNKLRSSVLITAIALGIWAAIFMSAFATGMIQGYIDSAITNVVSHLQIHHPDFKKNKETKYYFTEQQQKLAQIRTLPDVAEASSRTLVNAMLASSKGSRGVLVRGVEPEAERRLTHLDQNIVEGTYFNGKRKNQVLLSRFLAEKLKVKIRSKVVLTFQNLDQEITSAAFRIVGFYDTGNNIFDQAHIFVKTQDLNPLLLSEAAAQGQATNIAHQIALTIKDTEKLDSIQQQLSRHYPGLRIENYGEVAPDLQLYESQIAFVSLIYLVIIMLALVFGIINTTLMAVLERTRELGMLMAIGMNKKRVFLMIVTETIMLALVAIPVGLLLGWLTINYLGEYGINLSAYSEGLKNFGMSEIIYPTLNPKVFFQSAIAVTLTSIIAALYPAFKAVRLRPVEAIRKI
ncbi:MAG: FtsX-like permease family protein [Bacteroidota bacterium]